MMIHSRGPCNKINSALDLFSNENGFAIFIFYARPNGGHGRLTERTIRKAIGEDESPGFFSSTIVMSHSLFPGVRICIPQN